jgi:Ran GTPase-activating protein (RanGAP) involved in mRNA processing and transport
MAEVTWLENEGELNAAELAALPSVDLDAAGADDEPSGELVWEPMQATEYDHDFDDDDDDDNDDNGDPRPPPPADDDYAELPVSRTTPAPLSSPQYAVLPIQQQPQPQSQPQPQQPPVTRVVQSAAPMRRPSQAVATPFRRGAPVLVTRAAPAPAATLQTPPTAPTLALPPVPTRAAAPLSLSTGPHPPLPAIARSPATAAAAAAPAPPAAPVASPSPLATRSASPPPIRRVVAPVASTPAAAPATSAPSAAATMSPAQFQAAAAAAAAPDLSKAATLPARLSQPMAPQASLSGRAAGTSDAPAAEGAISKFLVVGYAKRHEGRPDEHVVYNLRVQRPGVEELELFKRFSEFADLHERVVVLTNQYNAQLTAAPAAPGDEKRFLPLPRMPAKLLVGADDRSVLQERVVGLQAFMEQLRAANPPIYAQLLEEFVRTDDAKAKAGILGTLRKPKAAASTTSNRSSMRVVNGLDTREIDNLRLFLKTREESEPSLIGQISLTNKRSTKKPQQRMLVVTLNRIYLMRAGCEKAEFDGHIRDVKAVTSLTENSVEIEFMAGAGIAGELEPLECAALITEIRIAEDILFPGRERAQKIALTIEPRGRLRQLRPTVCGPCGGFVMAFRSMLNYLHTPYGIVEQEIAYLVDNVLDFSNQFYFDFQQFNLQNADGEAVGSSTTVQAVMMALVHNLYFRGLIIENYRFDKEAFAALAYVLSHNGCFDTLLLDAINQGASGKSAGDGMSAVLQGLASNARLRGLSSIDLSNNVSLGRSGPAHLADFLAVAQQLRYLNLSNNGLAAAELALLCDRVAGNALSFGEHLVLLDLSLNTLACNDRSLAGALRALRSLRHLNLSGALEHKGGETCLPDVLAALQPSLELLDLSKNVLRRVDAPAFEVFLRRCPGLQELNVSECPKLDPAVAGAIVLSFGGNLIMRNNGIGVPLCEALAQCGAQWLVRSLDLSENPLGAAGFVRICEGAARSAPLQQLRLSSVFHNAKEDKGHAISSLLRLLARKATPLISLHMAGTNCPLGVALLPLLAALGQNKTLADLDLRDHLIGNRGATLLSQALQTNTSLVSLAYDGNQTTPSGFSAIDYALKRNAVLRRWPTPSKDVSFSLRIEILKIKRSDQRIKRRDVLLDAVQSIQESLLRNALEAERTLVSEAAPSDDARGGDADTGVGTGAGGGGAGGGGGAPAAAGQSGRQPVVGQFGSELDDLLNEPTELGGSGGGDETLLMRMKRPKSVDKPALPVESTLRRAGVEVRSVAQGQQTLKQQTSAAVQMARIRRPSVSPAIAQLPATAAAKRMFGRPLQLAVRVQDDGEMALPTFVAEILACVEKLHLRVPNLLLTIRNADRNRVELLRRDIDAGAPSEWLTAPVGALLALICLWLQSLPEPPFTFALLADWIGVTAKHDDASVQSEAATRVVRRLPPANQVVVRALFHFFEKLRHQRDVNGADSVAIARVFAPLLLRDPRPGSPPVSSAVELVAFLIDSYEMVFSDESEGTGSDLINATLRALTADRSPQYAAVPYAQNVGGADSTVSRRTERESLVWVEMGEDEQIARAMGLDDM